MNLYSSVTQDVHFLKPGREIYEHTILEEYRMIISGITCDKGNLKRIVGVLVKPDLIQAESEQLLGTRNTVLRLIKVRYRVLVDMIGLNFSPVPARTNADNDTRGNKTSNFVFIKHHSHKRPVA